jgi:hypothetical protein
MKNDDEILESLITGGFIGAALGALLSKGKENGATIGALAGAAILATFKASEQAKKSKVPIVFEENGMLYEIQADGTKRFIKELEKSQSLKNKNFTLK